MKLLISYPDTLYYISYLSLFAMSRTKMTTVIIIV